MLEHEFLDDQEYAELFDRLYEENKDDIWRFIASNSRFVSCYAVPK